MAPVLKLTYFDITGLAEVPRLLFHYAELPFEDERLSFDEFKNLKQTFPFKQVPVLKVDGAVLAQSEAIVRYAAGLAKVIPQDPWTCAQMEMTLGAFKDLSPSLIEIRYKTPDEAEKVKKITKFITETVPVYLGPVEKYTPETGFMHGTEPSLADFCAFNLFVNVLSQFKEFEPSNFPKLQAVAMKVQDLPTLSAYLSKK